MKVCPRVLTMLCLTLGLLVDSYWGCGRTQEEAQNTEIAGCSNRISLVPGLWGTDLRHPLQLLVVRVCTIEWRRRGEGKALIWRTWLQKALVNKYESLGNSVTFNHSWLDHYSWMSRLSLHNYLSALYFRVDSNTLTDNIQNQRKIPLQSYPSCKS